MAPDDRQIFPPDFLPARIQFANFAPVPARHFKMSLNLNPVSIGVREKFRPFQDSVAYPITRYLPFGTPARYLSLGACDIRKIFYTIYSEKGNGKGCVEAQV